jgi:glycosyltransferase involved in cell wall biosynthesis
MKITIMTPTPSAARINYYNALGDISNLTILAERKTPKVILDFFNNDQKKSYKEINLKGIRMFKYMALCPGILTKIRLKNFDIFIVEQYATPTAFLAIFYLNFLRIPFGLNVDGGFIKNESSIKRKIKKYFISSASFYLTSGENGSKYLEYYGADVKNIHIYPFSPYESKDFENLVLDELNKKKLKQELGITNEKLIITVGQFIHRKGIDILLQSLKNIDREVGVYIIGGEPTIEYINILKTNNTNNVYFLNFLKKSELKKYYQIADIVVLPTREDIWSFAVNEAMSFGIPVITTNRCGAGLEMIKDGINGFIVGTENSDELADKINILIDDYKLRMFIKENNINISKLYTSEAMAIDQYNFLENIRINNGN